MNTYVYKVILLGNSEVGKTTFFRKLKELEGAELENSSHDFLDSIELGSCTLEFSLNRSVTVQLEVNDTGSVERFRSIPTNYFRHTQGVVLMYDLTDPTSLYDLEDWISDAYSKTGEDNTITYLLIGNKKDRHNPCDMGASNGRTFCARHGIPEKLQFQVSAVKESKEDLQDIFKVLACEIYTMQTNKEPDASLDTDGSLLISDGEADGTESTSRCSRC